MSQEFELLVQEFEKFQTKIQTMQEQAADYAEVQADIAALEVTASSPDRSITVVAGPAGAVKDIRITEEALGQGAARLSGTVLSTLHQAVAAAARAHAELIERHAGPDLHVVDQVLAAQAEAFGTPPPEPRPADDVEPGGSVLRDGRPHPSPPAPPPTGSAGSDFLRNLGGEDEL